MKIDFSTILLVILCVIPGLFAQRSRNSVYPRSFDVQGSTTELGELVTLGISTHGILACLGALAAALLGLALHLQVGYFFLKLDQFPFGVWSARHRTESILFGTLYAFASFAASHWLGLVYGVWRQSSPITTWALSGAGWLKKLGVTGLLGERPIAYEALNPTLQDDGTPYVVFLEVEMKDDAGFYSGQLSEFAIVKDEEPHKPIYLTNVFYKKLRVDSYAELEADGVMLDLADALTLLVKQVPPGG